ncbi:uncharacterized protein Z518_02744 [Rhinocladiella mackenziei CBS 650.93]|uniref:Rhinocladiella mackenziei CBS 650.93 unplaced genomic scaffold supercont1.2, whole genome shotgun sequence n=1 Tax=Rhinocladiella mackenziei CBS 650.93 TaxID=1442369 RepID=A0A0D2IQB1_9EURO|nr:uncharacterized protein Z518_02744 [Rhinocladiella mackenziei CBS 650.93]KIX08089.1 hypothetical protein Z518_02744 [Rhinocladiella mackenziei CBS 650.93]
MAYKRSRNIFEADLQKQTSPYVLYGTPLPPWDGHIRDDGSFVPVWKQEVTDERGRKRLHGAFTGGFSAGYFNTVGSKEGWTPSSFVSSRQNRRKDSQKSAQQRPEDFMDEEDLREAEESRTLHMSNELAGFGTDEDLIRKSAAIDIFRPLDETIGSRLLKRMGWREGQGIGPRVKRVANLGNYDDELDETEETHLFAPEDVPIVSFPRKMDCKGLGYESELECGTDTTMKAHRRHEKPLASTESSDDDDIGPRLATTRKPLRRDRKTGIGVGILNDEGSDDDDPYSMGPKISYNKVIGGDKRSKAKSKNPLSSTNPLLKNKPTFVSKRLANLKGALRKCRDGRLPPDGFVLADQLDSFGMMAIRDDQYKPLEVPAGWKSSLSKETTAEPASTVVSMAEAAKSSNLTAKARASLLGESQLPGKSVFDFLTPAARDRLAVASGRENLPAAKSEPPPESYEASKSTPESLRRLVPSLDRDVALHALNRGIGGWMPYAEDENKRSRYRAYLEIQAGLRQNAGGDDLPPRADGMRQEDWVLEMHEFARAAQVFQPISSLMASRFTSSSSLPQSQNGESSTASADSLLTRPSARPEDPAESAAKLGMFGPMTRSVSNFYPSRLLCKRFNVPVPNPSNFPASGMGGDVTLSAQEQSSAATPFRSFMSAGLQHDGAAETSDSKRGGDWSEKPKSEEPDTERDMSVASAVMDSERNEALEQERPGQAVFKAIFGSDDEDE